MEFEQHIWILRWGMSLFAIVPPLSKYKIGGWSSYPSSSMWVELRDTQD